MENHEGRLSNLLKILSDNKINIRSLNIAETMDYGVVRLILNETDKAIEVLKANNIMSLLTPVLAAEVTDHPGGLSRLVDVLTQAKINIIYAYSFLPKNTDNAIIILRIEENVFEQAIKVLNTVSEVELLDEATLLLK
jgi:hypothetical protein